MTQHHSTSIPSQVTRVRRTPAEIAHDPTLSNARKIELLKSIKEHNAGAKDPAIIRDADLALEEMLRFSRHQ
ncbi:hypothetical protein [Pelagibacterium xiamenense]|uniref:hypothetical protein n=1 Tax=Pelagibacterium xiamenense TaxID=2901140 RepID=UPI001E42483F|nr:hypothetical protein [Pelagibacterium xiamenense]MCD7060176.1 hypothetical protein [Pelagibacterium xiamenense]